MRSTEGASLSCAAWGETLRHWRSEILAHYATGASNGPVEAANLLIKQVKRSGRGFQSFANYRLRILFAEGHCTRDTGPVTSMRTRPSHVRRVGPLKDRPHSTSYPIQVSLFTSKGPCLYTRYGPGWRRMSKRTKYIGR